VAEDDGGLRLGDPDGYGHFGVLSEGRHGLICHECGDQHRHLGLHVWKAHGIKAATYGEAHGLLRSRGLVAADLRDVLAANAAVRYTEDAALARARDPAAAMAARLQGAKPASAEEAANRDARMALVGRSGRRGTVVTCQWCGVEFCPLTGASRRRFCSRSCASRHTRATA
jgi:hypothetical protein